MRGASHALVGSAATGGVRREQEIPVVLGADTYGIRSVVIEKGDVTVVFITTSWTSTFGVIDAAGITSIHQHLRLA
jgi:hypothetical protein